LKLLKDTKTQFKLLNLVLIQMFFAPLLATEHLKCGMLKKEHIWKHCKNYFLKIFEIKKNKNQVLYELEIKID
jgi:hypothetical protein